MRYLILASLLLTGQFCFGQKREFSFQVNSGLFSFGAKSATNSSYIVLSDVVTVPPYTNSPYGTNSSFSYGVGVRFQQLTRSNFIYGLALSCESLVSKLSIDNAAGLFFMSVQDGKTILSNNFINLFPSIGQRVEIVRGIDSDLLFGFDFGFGLSSKEKYSATLDQGNEISGTNKREIPTVDFRPRIEFINYYKNFGLSIGYSYGLTNYQKGLVGGDREAKSRYLRFGLSYRLR